MECPKCDGKLQPHQIGDQLIQACSKCAGIWLRYGQLPSLLLAWAHGAEFAQPHHNQLGENSRRGYVLNWDQVLGYCPACSTPSAMIPSFRDIGGRIRVDYCQRGHGIWLDAFEIRHIQSRIRHKFHACEDMLRRLLTVTGDGAATADPS